MTDLTQCNMKKQRYIVEIEMPDGDFISAGWLKDLIQTDCDVKDEDRNKVTVQETSLPSNLDEAADTYTDSQEGDYPFSEGMDNFCYGDIHRASKAGAEWMAGQGWHDVTETPSIFGFYLVIHEKGWCVANYMGKGVVCESGWVEAINRIEIERPQKWLDLRDLIPKKQ